MPSQIDQTRVYTDSTEQNDTRKIRCTKCKVYAVPRGINDTIRNTSTGAVMYKQTHCPNCGHIHNRPNH